MWTKEDDKSLFYWYEKLAHQNINTVKSFLKARNIPFVDEKFFCDSCIKGKHHPETFKKSERKAKEVGDLVHAGLCVPMENESIGGSKYMMLLKDDLQVKEENESIKDSKYMLLLKVDYSGHRTLNRIFLKHK